MNHPFSRGGPRLTKDRAITAAKHFAHETVANGNALTFEVRGARRVKTGHWVVELTETGNYWTLDFDASVEVKHGQLHVHARGHEPYFEPNEESPVPPVVPLRLTPEEEAA